MYTLITRKLTPYQEKKKWKWDKRTERARKHEDPIQLRDRETLIYLLDTYAKDFKSQEIRKDIEQAAKIYLEKCEEVNLDKLREQVIKTKKDISLNSIKNVDLLIAYLSLSDTNLAYLHNDYDSDIQEMHEYVSFDMIELMKKRAWMRIDCKSHLFHNIFSLSYLPYRFIEKGYQGSLEKLLVIKYLWNKNEYRFHHLWRDNELFQPIDAQDLLNIYRFLLFDKDMDQETLTKKLRGLLDKFARENHSVTGREGRYERRRSFPYHFLKYGGSRRALQSYIETGVVSIDELEPHLRSLENLEIESVIENWMRLYAPFVGGFGVDTSFHDDDKYENRKIVLDAFENLDDSVVTKDVKTNTYPFMQAVDNYCSTGLDVLYYLLRRNPKPIVDAVQIENQSKCTPSKSQNDQLTFTSDNPQQKPILNDQKVKNDFKKGYLTELSSTNQSSEERLKAENEELKQRISLLESRLDKTKQKIKEQAAEVVTLRKENNLRYMQRQRRVTNNENDTRKPSNKIQHQLKLLRSAADFTKETTNERHTEDEIESYTVDENKNFEAESNERLNGKKAGYKNELNEIMPAEIRSSTDADVPNVSNKVENETEIPHRYSKRLKILKTAVPIKKEDIVDGVVKCPVCLVSIVTAEKGCKIISCRNHSPQFLYFCIHCKKVNEDGVDYITCSCDSRNTRETRLKAQKRRNEEAKANPVEIE